MTRPTGHHLSADERARIVAMIEADPHRSARSIAAETGHLPVTIRRIRQRALGAQACVPRGEHVERVIEALARFPDDQALARKAARMSPELWEASCRRAALEGRLPADALPAAARPAPGFEVAGVATTLDARGRVRSRSVRTRRAAGDRFETPAGHRVKGVSTLVDEAGRTIAKWVKTAENAVDPDAVRGALSAALAGWRGCAGVEPEPAFLAGDLLTQYTVADLHMGLLAWGRETGQPYDLDIARRMVTGAVGELVERAPPSEQAILLFLGDTTHQNDRTNMTPRSGHVLDVDGRFQKVLRTTAETAMQLVHKARSRHGRVRVRFVPGNHDPEVAIALTLALSLAYADDKRVIIDDSPGGHFFHRFGDVLIGATHGHTMPPERMAMMLATDRAEDWGQTRHRHFFFGHVHRESAREIGGVRVESFNSPAGRDAYAHDGGFRSGRALVSITYHRERGEVQRHRVNIG